MIILCEDLVNGSDKRGLKFLVLCFMCLLSKVYHHSIVFPRVIPCLWGDWNEVGGALDGVVNFNSCEIWKTLLFVCLKSIDF